MSYIPPASYSGSPVTYALAPSTVLHRIGPYRFPPSQFKAIRAHRYFDGGRFDATDDDGYSYLYAALTIEGAIAERLLRDRPVDPAGGTTVLTRRELEGLHACTVDVVQPLTLVDLTSLAGLAAVHQSSWLTTVDPTHYAQTRHWGHQIRAWAPAAHGFIWRSRRDPADLALILFGDRVPEGALADGGAPVPLDKPTGRAYLNGKLPFGFAVAP